MHTYDAPKISLAVVLFTDIVGSTERAAELGDEGWRDLRRKHHARVRSELRRFGGHEANTAGDGFLATFDRPAPAILCACAVRDGVRELGLEIRSGIHMGEVEGGGRPPSGTLPFRRIGGPRSTRSSGSTRRRGAGTSSSLPPGGTPIPSSSPWWKTHGPRPPGCGTYSGSRSALEALHFSNLRDLSSEDASAEVT